MATIKIPTDPVTVERATLEAMRAALIKIKVRLKAETDVDLEGVLVEIGEQMVHSDLRRDLNNAPSVAADKPRSALRAVEG